MGEHRRWWPAALLVAALVACTPDTTAPPVASSSSPAARDFTVMTTVPITQSDPAVMTDEGSAVLAYNAFQRLMSAAPGEGVLKPDAASDCLFRSPTVYECTLKEKLAFTNGNPLTTSDVRFSIARAYRLAPAGSTAHQLSALDHIQVVDDTLIRFHLKWADGQFGFALASPAASIVDEDAYDADLARGLHDPPSGSGPFVLTALTDAGAIFTRNDGYNGFTPVRMQTLNLTYASDSATIEKAMEDGTVDVVWRGLSEAALTRLDAQTKANADGTTNGGFTRVVLPGAQVQRLVWNPSSGYRINADLRSAISAALQDDRTLDSIVPNGVAGHVPAFKLGGSPTIKPAQGSRFTLRLSFDAHVSGQRDLASQVRDRIEQTVGVSVRLVPNATDADLTLTDQGAYIQTPYAWLQPYLQDPLPGSAAKVDELEQQARSSTDAAARDLLLGEIQQQAGVDATVLPIKQADRVIFIARGVDMSEPRYGPGYQLGLWTFRKA